MSVADLEREREALRREEASIAERAAEGGESEELFPQGAVEGDERKTLKNLIRAGIAIETTAKLSSAEVPLRGGLVDFEGSGEVLVTYEAGKLELVPKLERDPGGSARLERVKARQTLRSIYVQPAGGLYTREQVLDLLSLAGVADERAAELLG